MECVAPSAANWRGQFPYAADDRIQEELQRAWSNRDARTRPLNDRNYHDWCNFRAATLREARKRGLDISVTGLGT